jgi:hypothetical protein
MKPRDIGSQKETLTPVQRWLGAARVTDDPAGDLIADMRRDMLARPDEFPRLFGGVRSMRAHLEKRNASVEAHAAVPVVWRRYRAWLNRNPFSSQLKQGSVG